MCGTRPVLSATLERRPIGPVGRDDAAKISPQLFQSWMQYVTPLLANSTRAAGEFQSLGFELKCVRDVNLLHGLLKVLQEC